MMKIITRTINKKNMDVIAKTTDDDDRGNQSFLTGFLAHKPASHMEHVMPGEFNIPIRLTLQAADGPGLSTTNHVIQLLIKRS